MNGDRLSHLRSARSRDSKSFFNNLRDNCKHAVSHEQAREITRNIKKPLAEVVIKRGKS